MDPIDEKRRRWAQTLHSTVAQHLAALHLNLSIIEKSQLSPHARRALEESIALAEQSARELQNRIADLHPPILENFGLIEALRALAAERQTHLTVGPKPELLRLDPGLEISIYRIFESIPAPQVDIRTGKQLRMTFSEISKIPPEASPRIKALKARATLRNATLTISIPLDPRP